MKVVIVTPVFGDWEAFAQLSHEIAAVVTGSGNEYEVLAVNDDSPTEPDHEKFAPGCRVLNLTCNLGHQRAALPRQKRVEFTSGASIKTHASVSTAPHGWAAKREWHFLAISLK